MWVSGLAQHILGGQRQGPACQQPALSLLPWTPLYRLPDPHHVPSRDIWEVVNQLFPTITLSSQGTGGTERPQQIPGAHCHPSRALSWKTYTVERQRWPYLLSQSCHQEAQEMWSVSKPPECQSHGRSIYWHSSSCRKSDFVRLTFL